MPCCLFLYLYSIQQKKIHQFKGPERVEFNQGYRYQDDRQLTIDFCVELLTLDLRLLFLWGISCINTIFGLTLFYRRWVIWLDGGLRGYCVATNCILVRDLCKCRGLAEPGLTLRCLWTLWSCSSVSPMSGVLVTGHPVTQIAINTCRQLKSLMCHPQC